MPLREVIYQWALRLGRRILLALPVGSKKLRVGLARRDGVVDRIESWARERRRDDPLIWLHAPSVGEGLQTRPVIELLRERRPDLQLFYTFFSPSAEDFAGELPVDGVDYLPLDLATEMAPVIDALRPAAIVFGKYDVWPTLSRLAVERTVPLALVSATLAPNSSRLRASARFFLKPAYRRLEAVGAISEADARRLTRLGVPERRIRVTGDARFDQVWMRAHMIDRAAPPVALLTGHAGTTLVAGSTWPKDERKLVPALDALHRDHPDLRVVIVPHEPESSALARLARQLEASGFRPALFSELEPGPGDPPSAVLVDQVGVLAEIYGAADMAYVGGAFGSRGIHSVLEPAALGIPVVFGPRHGNAREATELVACGGAVSVSGSQALQKTLREWLEEPDARRQAGIRAEEYVRDHLGASRRNADLVLDLLD